VSILVLTQLLGIWYTVWSPPWWAVEISSCPSLGCSYVLDERRAVVQMRAHNMYCIPIESGSGGASNIVIRHSATHAKRRPKVWSKDIVSGSE
jgi:hypothetical protein